MTSVVITRLSSNTAKLHMAGHSGFSFSGADIVCAAATTAIRMLEVTLNDVLSANLPVSVNESDASITIDLTCAPAEIREVIEVVVSGFARLIGQLSEEYPENIQLLEVQHNA